MQNHQPNHQPSLSDVETLCGARGVRLTKQRRETFEVLRAANKPMSAYDLLALLEARLQRKLAPLTVYRTLDFLVEHGFVHKITSNHTYIVCDHPEDKHEAMHLICTACGSGQELPITDIKTLIATAAISKSFTAQRHTIEIEGLCEQCSA